jgi:hypothetical protein
MPCQKAGYVRLDVGWLKSRWQLQLEIGELLGKNFTEQTLAFPFGLLLKKSAGGSGSVDLATQLDAPLAQLAEHVTLNH